MGTPPYRFSSIASRAPMHLPDGKRLAVWLGLALEHFELGKPGTSLFTGSALLDPDPLNHGWRDYGWRVGLWRMIKLFDRLGIRASAIVNSRFCENNPEIIAAGMARDWTWIAHGPDMTFHTGLAPDQEEVMLMEMMSSIAEATGRPPRGWLGPALTETYATPALLARAGVDYICDWPCDDQPFPLNVRDAKLISVPYSVEVNDVPMSYNGASGPDIYNMIVDSVDVLRSEGAESARILGLGLHPFIIGVPWRFKYFAKALEDIAKLEDVWITTSDDIATWYLQNYYDRDVSTEM